ncbi:hypothetical protein L914_16649 [Phytophthora nicotianae]|uniref:Uncharacterized protein n=1 Tax=Phytophthora nicotianae TaxID=4792 RepID=W2MMM7_PHYNI|nr:hypothetical protein L914_16649 [Phytophthora nicotianae]
MGRQAAIHATPTAPRRKHKATPPRRRPSSPTTATQAVKRRRKPGEHANCNRRGRQNLDGSHHKSAHHAHEHALRFCLPCFGRRERVGRSSRIVLPDYPRLRQQCLR